MEIKEAQLRAMNCGAITDVSELKGDLSRFTMEPKFDGFRLIAHVTDEGVRFYTRAMKEQVGKLPHIAELLAKAYPAGTVIDGEIIALEAYEDEDGFERVRNNFEHVQSVMLSKGTEHLLKNKAKPLTYAQFDCTFFNGADIRSEPLTVRRNTLKPCGAWVTVTATWPAEQTIYEALCEMGFEGAVVKSEVAPYVNGSRGKGWWKMKKQDTVDVIITGYQPGRGKFAGLVGAVKFGQPCPKTGEIIERGQASGMDDAERREMTQNADALIGTVISVAHMGIMASGIKFRHPQFKMMRPDKPANEVVWDNG